MPPSDLKKTCFVIMPISTPASVVDTYLGDGEHFKHTFESLFCPAIEKAGFEVISPVSRGSEVIQADIIGQLSQASLVLCDMSMLNANVFFEFGIRTALDMPVALVVDEKSKGDLPFDTGILNFHTYDSSLCAWNIEEQIQALASHIRAAYEKSDERNALWKYFGIAQTGELKSDAASERDKLELILHEINALKKQSNEIRHLYNKSQADFFNTVAHDARTPKIQNPMDKDDWKVMLGLTREGGGKND